MAADYVTLRVHRDARDKLKQVAARLTGREGQTVTLSDALRTACSSILAEATASTNDSGS